jgi:iron complex transport system substrate-binding protein
VVAPCGFRLAAALEQAASIRHLLPAVPIWAMDADGLVVRPGPRLVTGVEALATAIHPDAFSTPPPPGAISHLP